MECIFGLVLASYGGWGWRWRYSSVGDDPDCCVTVINFDELNSDVALAVELLDHVLFSRHQRRGFPGPTIFSRTTGTLEYDRNFVAVFPSVLVNPISAVVINVIVFNLGDLIQPKNNKRVNVPLVIRNAIEDKIARGCSIDGIDCFGLVRILSKLIILSWVVTHSFVIETTAISHETSLIAVRAFARVVRCGQSQGCGRSHTLLPRRTHTMYCCRRGSCC